MSARLGDCSASCTSALSHQCERIYAIVARAGVSPIAARRGARRRGFGRATLREPEYLHFFLCSVSDGTTPDANKITKSKRNTALYVATCYDWALGYDRARDSRHTRHVRVSLSVEHCFGHRHARETETDASCQISRLSLSLALAERSRPVSPAGALSPSRAAPQSPSHLYV